ncbi:SymE family type I addiction module toxin [Citrobacter sp. C348]|mgnify:CR=1 FL=1|jgi:toxic protein SymE|uniref:Type I toxin-antitoxin system SymE family toxin n=2 Tax=Citrobacter freundii complex TaxID=1344959 RepID=A0A7H9FVZ9_CITFR|nr:MULTISPECIES: SymE family type I addiction module toxin [Citrobacter]STE15563.1 endoribonuclease SymE [Escherichia coli]MBA7731323.1 type I toxin-antitoxin system SymE family toxin [Citrobacter freundii]MBA8065025.1 type I toxin-antitoxin system SymE family toxin [Citrobacter freundii]MBA8196770.1 type I toxin-antitoxin system SymE family toxin [Citrobacter freundii]MBD0830186.1 type I toxin-antitoxin system SymE family toxin [Citrobacter sp. C1]
MSTDNVQTPMIIAKPVRRLKVGYVRRRYEDRRTGFTLRISRHASLTLNGDWLEQAGFPTGTEVNVSVMQGKLIIEQATE